MMGRPMERWHEAARSRGAGGFTLLELMIALTVFSIGMLSLNGMLLSAIQGGSRGRHTTQAAAIAESRMERLQRLSWSQIAPTAGWSAAVQVNNAVQGNPDRVEQAYTLDWRIADLQPGWTRSIDVRVRWDEPDRPGRSVTFASVRFNREGT
jgi:prepilin-type N-terminal cleavage/methylation domain-containing protein